MGNSPTLPVYAETQSIPLPGTEVIADAAINRLGSTQTYRSFLSPDKLVDSYHAGITTIYSNFWQRGYLLQPNRPCLGWRPSLFVCSSQFLVN